MEIVKTYVNLFGTDVQDSHKKFSPLKVLEKRIYKIEHRKKPPIAVGDSNLKFYIFKTK